MIVNDCGFPMLEPVDHASPAGISMLGELADSWLARQEVELSELERPSVAVACPSSPELVPNGSADGWPIPFDNVVYTSIAGNYSGLSFFYESGPGIYYIGTSIDAVGAGTINAAWVDLRMTDYRGARLLNRYSESYRHGEGYTTARGAISLNASGIVEVRSPEATAFGISEFGARLNFTGTGTLTVQTVSTLWKYKIRGLSNV
jgi:hypothetical protein